MNWKGNTLTLTVERDPSGPVANPFTVKLVRIEQPDLARKEEICSAEVRSSAGQGEKSSTGDAGHATCADRILLAAQVLVAREA